MDIPQEIVALEIHSLVSLERRYSLFIPFLLQIFFEIFKNDGWKRKCQSSKISSIFLGKRKSHKMVCNFKSCLKFYRFNFFNEKIICLNSFFFSNVFFINPVFKKNLLMKNVIIMITELIGLNSIIVAFMQMNFFLQFHLFTFIYMPGGRSRSR